MVASSFGPDGPTTTVIVSFYNQANELRLLLEALAAQTDLHFNVILADDGSSPPASELMTKLESTLPFPVETVWQEDAGFCKTRILNLSTLRTKAELLVFLDGDCIPFRNLVETYRRCAIREEFLVGGVGFLDAATSAALLPEDVRAGRHERSLSLRERLRIRSIHLRNLLHRGGKQTRPRIRGGNFAVAAALFQRINGFDEVYCGYGKEDSDLRNRLRNAGALGVSLWPQARAVHLARAVSPSGTRASPPLELYMEGRCLIEARLGLRSHPA